MIGIFLIFFSSTSTKILSSYVVGFISDYVFYLQTISYNLESVPLAIPQPTYTDDILYSSIEVHASTPKELKLTITTGYGTGAKHRCYILGELIVPQIQTKTFALVQVGSCQKHYCPLIQ